MNNARWLIGGPGLVILGLGVHLGLTPRFVVAVVGVIAVTVAGVRFDRQINAWWEQLETRIRRQAPASRSVGHKSFLRPVVLAGKALASFFLRVVTGRTFRASEGDRIEPLTSVRIGTLVMELGILNVTAGEKNYAESTEAAVDDVVQAQLAYLNEGPSSPSLSVRTSLSDADEAQQYLQLEVVVGGEMAKLVIPVTLSWREASLALEPNSTMLRYQDPDGHFQEMALSDAGGRLIAVELVPPKGRGSITVLARAQAPGVSINLVASSEQHPKPAPKISAAPCSDVSLEITVRNRGNVRLRDLMLQANLGPGMRHIPGSTELNTGNGWERGSDDLIDPVHPTAGHSSGRLKVGDLEVGAEASVRWRVRLSDGRDYVSFVVAVMRAVGLNEFYNTAAIGVPSLPESCGSERPTRLRTSRWRSPTGADAVT